MRLGKILAVGALALEKIWHRVEPQPVDAYRKPEVEHLEDRLDDIRVIEVDIRLVRIEAVPVIRLRKWVPGPIGNLIIFEDDPRILILFRSLAPDVKVALARARRRAPCSLKPGVLIRCVIDD